MGGGEKSMSIERYEGEIMNLTKEGIDILMNKMYIDINPNMVEKDINYLLRKFVIKLVDLKKYEFIHRAFNDCEKLKEMMEYYPEDADYFYHHYLRSTSINGRYLDAICLYEDEEINIDKQLSTSKFYENINFNFARAHMKLGKYEKALELTQKNNDIESRLLEAHIYSLMNSEKELLVYNSMNIENESDDIKSHIYLGYSQYYLKVNKFQESEKYLKKLKNSLKGIPLGKKNVRYYDTAVLSKKLNNSKDYLYYLELCASANAGGLTQIEYKLKAILDLLVLGIIDREDIIDYLPREKYLLESDMIKEYIEKIRGL